MRLSKRCEYGIRAVVHLAQHQNQGYTQSREIAEAEALPAKFLESILLTLRAGAFLESKVGAGGGYRLARPAEKIHILDIVTLLDPPDSDFSQAGAHNSTPEPSRTAPRGGESKPAETSTSLTGPSAPIAVVNARLDDAFLSALGQLDLATLAALTTPDGGQNPQFESRVVCC